MITTSQRDPKGIPYRLVQIDSYCSFSSSSIKYLHSSQQSAQHPLWLSILLILEVLICYATQVSPASPWDSLLF